MMTMHSSRFHFLFMRIVKNFYACQSKMFFNNGENRRHTFRDRRPCTTASQVAGRCRHINWNSVQRGKKYFVLGWVEQPRQNKVSCTGTMSPTNQPRKDPVHLYSLSPHSLQFQQSAGAGTPLWSHWENEKHPKDDLMDQSCVLRSSEGEMFLKGTCSQYM